jgi:hypothetical protein
MFTREDKLNQLRLIASRDGRDGSVTVHQHVDLYASILQQDRTVEHSFKDSHKIFVQVISGDITVNDQVVSAGDGAQITEQDQLIVKSQSEAEFLVFDMG